MSWYKTAQEVYRGDPEPLSIHDFDPEYGVKELGKQLGSSAAEGPGIYFTDKEDDARMYGSNITSLKLKDANILTTSMPKFSTEQIEDILGGIDPETMEGAVSNWNEYYELGKAKLIDYIMNAEDPIDQLMSIWAEVFYRQNPSAFMQLMTSKGIDGIAIQKEGPTHYIIYNRDVLK